MTQRPLRIDVTQCLQTLLGCLRRQPRFTGVEARHRLKQRSVEQLLVQPAHLPLMPFPLGGEFFDRIGSISHTATQHAQLVDVIGHQMSALQTSQLQPVFQRALESVSGRQSCCIISTHIPPRCE